MVVSEKPNALGIDFEVCVRCFTYNQRKYIEQTIEGFERQVTDFPFVCVVVDDASTDGEKEFLENYFQLHYSDDEGTIIREETDNYLLLASQNKKNYNCHLALYLLKTNHYSSEDLKAQKMGYISQWMDSAKYVAICEGDDYWIVDDKLQLQVSFLNKNPNYVLVYTDAIIVDKDSHIIDTRPVKRYSGNCLKTLISYGNYIVTASVCYRNSVDHDWLQVRNQIPFRLLLGDKPHWIFLANLGLFYYIQKKMTAYRVIADSASHTKNYQRAMDYSENIRHINLYFNEKYHAGVSIYRINSDAQLHRIRSSIVFGKRVFIKEISNCVATNPFLLFRLELWKILALSMMKRRC